MKSQKLFAEKVLPRLREESARLYEKKFPQGVDARVPA